MSETNAIRNASKLARAARDAVVPFFDEVKVRRILRERGVVMSGTFDSVALKFAQTVLCELCDNLESADSIMDAIDAMPKDIAGNPIVEWAGKLPPSAFEVSDE